MHPRHVSRVCKATNCKSVFGGVPASDLKKYARMWSLSEL